MEQTKIIDLLRRMEKNAWACHKAFKDDRKYALAREYAGEVEGLQRAIMLLTDTDYVERVSRIYGMDA